MGNGGQGSARRRGGAVPGWVTVAFHRRPRSFGTAVPTCYSIYLSCWERLRSQLTFFCILWLPSPLSPSEIFAIAPGAVEMFSFKDEADMYDSPRFKKHALGVVKVVSVAVKHLNNLDNVVPVLKSLGAKHVQYGVVEAHCKSSPPDSSLYSSSHPRGTLRAAEYRRRAKGPALLLVIADVKRYECIGPSNQGWL